MSKKLEIACKEYETELAKINSFSLRNKEVIDKYTKMKTGLDEAEKNVKEHALPLAKLGETNTVYQSAIVKVDVTWRRMWDVEKAREVLPASLYRKLLITKLSIDSKKAEEEVDTDLAEEIIVDGGTAVAIKLNKHV